MSTADRVPRSEGRGEWPEGHRQVAPAVVLDLPVLPASEGIRP